MACKGGQGLKGGGSRRPGFDCTSILSALSEPATSRPSGSRITPTPGGLRRLEAGFDWYFTCWVHRDDAGRCSQAPGTVWRQARCNACVACACFQAHACLHRRQRCDRKLHRGGICILGRMRHDVWSLAFAVFSGSY